MDATDVPLPAAFPLLQRDLADDVIVGDGDQRERLVIVEVAASLFAEAARSDALLDEQALDLGHSLEELDEGLLICCREGANGAGSAVIEHLHERVAFESVVDHSGAGE